MAEEIVKTEEELEQVNKDGAYMTPEAIEEMNAKTAKAAVQELMDRQAEEKAELEKKTAQELNGKIKGFDYESIRNKIRNKKTLTQEETAMLLESNAILGDANRQHIEEKLREEAIADGLNECVGPDGEFLLIDSEGKTMFNIDCSPEQIRKGAKAAAKLYNKAQTESIAAHEAKWGKPTGRAQKAPDTVESMRDEFVEAKKAKSAGRIAAIVEKAHNAGVSLY